LDKYHLWFKTENTKLGDQFIADFEKAINYLSEYPLAQKIERNSLRQLKIGRFQCLIIYEVVSKKSVIVYRIIHSKMNPSQKSRKPS
jgi:plasmid stabilization system protein ParE